MIKRTAAGHLIAWAISQVLNYILINGRIGRQARAAVAKAIVDEQDRRIEEKLARLRSDGRMKTGSTL